MAGVLFNWSSYYKTGRFGHPFLPLVDRKMAKEEGLEPPHPSLDQLLSRQWPVDRLGLFFQIGRCDMIRTYSASGKRFTVSLGSPTPTHTRYSLFLTFIYTRKLYRNFRVCQELFYFVEPRTQICRFDFTHAFSYFHDAFSHDI